MGELRKAFAPEIAEQTVEHVLANSGIAVVAVVGENMHGIPGMAGRTFMALGREGINIIAIAQGSSEYNISFIVEAGSMQRTVATLHREFRLQEAGSNSDASRASETRSPLVDRRPRRPASSSPIEVRKSISDQRFHPARCHSNLTFSALAQSLPNLRCRRAVRSSLVSPLE